ncbi:MAG: DUF839 domain-containing protein [Dehalococcoidia bacterium]|nr:DUF839 domain-containing protein [Dehalococcoidia bacterium]
MTNDGGRPRRRVLPLRLFERGDGKALREQLIPNKCLWKCSGACFHQAPNETNANAREPFARIAERRLSRRRLLQGAAAVSVPLVLAATPAGSALVGGSPLAPRRVSAAGGVPGTSLGFAPVPLNQDDAVTVPAGYAAQVLLRWGDPLFPGVERMTIDNASAELQARTFGYNCDLNAFFPLPRGGSSSTSGVLCVNHEYTEGPRMFTDYDAEHPAKAQVDVELDAHGMTVVELGRVGDVWGAVLESQYNRRITATTTMEITGPLAGDPRLRTSDDRSGRRVSGMLNNCAGGKTPWGTVLTAEENWHQYFGNNDDVADTTQRERNARYSVPGGVSQRRWEEHYRRFDVSEEPNEINRFGYIVEIDPYDPDFVPKKRTAMGRFKHEAGTIALANDGRVVAYSGDDERFEYVYKFVSDRAYKPQANHAANRDLLDSGTLYAARFNDDGTGEWLPLTPEALPGWDLADILLDTRAAADVAGATPMDRPEDVEVNPLNNRVYVLLTNNTAREGNQVDAPNPRGPNRYGHVLEISEVGGDLAAQQFTWEFFLICGDPSDDDTFYAGFDKSQVSAIAAPDNATFDALGNIWIATDGQGGSINRNDTVFAVPTAGPDRGKVQPFLTVPIGAEVCGPEFTPDFETLFVNVQHPGEDSDGPNNPQSVWPDGVWPPLPSLVAVTKDGGGRIGS